MKSALALRLLSSFVVGALMSGHALAADVAASAVVVKEVSKSVSSVVAKPVAAGKVATQTGAVVGRAGDNQYPSGAPIVPPKPKKDGPEAAAAAIKANVAKP